MVDVALTLGASRIEIAHVQYYGWALKNRAALMPSREQVERAARRRRWRNYVRVTTAASSSMRSCPTTAPGIQSHASAAGAAAPST